MATSGKARDRTIKDLSNHKAFSRKGFGMSAVEGAVSSTGRLETPYVEQYHTLANSELVAYTVLSYATPIAWVTTSGSVIVPDVRYSNTTTHHQSLCRVYL